MDDICEFGFPARARGNVALKFEIRTPVGGSQLSAVIVLRVEIWGVGIGVAPEATGTVIAPLRDSQVADLENDRGGRGRATLNDAIFRSFAALTDDILDPVAC